MTDHLPSVRQIDNARIPLRQATDLAIIVEAIEGRVTDDFMRFQARQLLSNLQCAASRLGFRLEPITPVSLVIDNTMKENA